MKKIIYIAVSLLIMLSFSSCHLFQSDAKCDAYSSNEIKVDKSQAKTPQLEKLSVIEEQKK